MSVFHNNALIGAGGGAVAAGFQIDRSLRFNSADSAYLNRTPSSAGNRKTWTWSGWVKRSKLSTWQMLLAAGSDNSNRTFIAFVGSDTPTHVDRITVGNLASGIVTGSVYLNPQLRDLSAWYHIVISADLTNSTANDRVKGYINGAEVDVTVDNAYEDTNTQINNTVVHQTKNSGGSSEFIDGYLAEVNFVDGQALAASDFGEYDDNNVWQPKEYSGTYGTNGFRLTFADNSSDSALGTDSSGNSNTFTVNNLTGYLLNPDVSIANATGALPIRNTTGTYGGTVATGNRTDSQSGLQLAMPLRNALNDESGNSYTITNTGVTFTTDHSKFYGQSAAFFDSDKVNISNASGLGAFGTGDFTVEAYVKFTDNGHHFGRVIEFGSVNNNGFVIDGSTAPFRLRYDGNNNSVYGTAGTIPLNKWTHVAAVRSSGTLKFYVDGVEGGSHTFTYSLGGGSAQLGNYLGSQLDFDGYMQDLRVYSSAKYTSNFTPPNDPANGLPGEGLDSLIDTPTNGTQSDTGAGGEVSGNYCTLNPLDNESHTLSNGNLDITNFGSTRQTHSTILPSSGKWYAEFTCKAAMNDVQIGVANNDGTSYLGSNTDSWGVISINGNSIHNNSQSSYGSSFTTGDTVMVALDLDNGKWYAGKNGTWFNSGDPANGTNPAHSGLSGNIGFAVGSNNTGGDISCNFGQRAFAYSAPSGYKAINTASLPTPTIADGSTAHNTLLYTGNGTARSITGLNFSPDWVWIKRRDTASAHVLTDAVRGTDKQLFSDRTNAEQTSTTAITSFNSDGFSLGTQITGTGDTNASGTYVAWCWDGGTSTVSNTDGSITSNVRANQSAGFSIVGFTGGGSGSTFGHGLNAAPHMIIVKDRDVSSDWCVYHKETGGGNFTKLNSTDASAANTTMWGNTDPTSSVFGWGFGSGNDYIAYCFSPVSQFSSFGKYTGNGSTDGPFVALSFRPAFLMFKRTDSTGTWEMYDTARDTYNPYGLVLTANGNGAESDVRSGYPADILSNGFKLRHTGAAVNASGGTYIYMAFAEHPFKTARAR